MGTSARSRIIPQRRLHARPLGTRRSSVVLVQLVHRPQRPPPPLRARGSSLRGLGLPAQKSRPSARAEHPTLFSSVARSARAPPRARGASPLGAAAERRQLVPSARGADHPSSEPSGFSTDSSPPRALRSALPSLVTLTDVPSARGADHPPPTARTQRPSPNPLRARGGQRPLRAHGSPSQRLVSAAVPGRLRMHAEATRSAKRNVSGSPSKPRLRTRGSSPGVRAHSTRGHRSAHARIIHSPYKCEHLYRSSLHMREDHP